MSGLEGLAAFGLACNVMQAISFSIEMISVCRTVFHNGSPDPSMASLLTHSTDITTSLERSISSASSIGPDERKLLDIARECLDVIAKLKIEVGKCSSSSAKGKYLPSIGLALQAKWKESKVAKLESQMQKHQRVLDSGLLVHIWKKTDATQLGQDAGFQRLDSNLRKYIRDVSDRLRAAEDEAIQTRKTVTSTIISEAAKTHDMVTQTVTSTIISEAAKTHDMVTQMTLDQRKATLLKSRNYPTRGHRFDQVALAHEGTCQWIIQRSQPKPNDADNTFTEPNHTLDKEDGTLDEGDTTSACPHRTLGGFAPLWSCFACWLKSGDQKIYWVQGKAASGKSTLMKFLCTKPDLWWPQEVASLNPPLIIHHFLWAAGAPIQRSIRGILLHLLYQLLSKKDTGQALQNIFQKVPSAEIKEFEGDWTGEELEKATLSTLELLATASTPIFIFLDGLDEIGASNPGMSDDPPGLLRLVEKLSAVDHVRLCVSSRPEFVFKKQLGAMPSLRLQDLTRPDMEKYAKDELLSNEVVGLKDQAEYRKLVNKLCDMSDGVFLWTALAVRSLSRGLTNEDDISELYARLEKMPKGLYALYKDMWERLNEDQDLYKKEAAQCFNLVMHWQRMPSHEFSKRCTKFHLLASLDPSISRACLNDDKPRFSSDLEAACKRIGKRVEIRSAGLLELGDQGSIDFIHRSALEFLMDTPEGQQIMAHDKSTPNELRSWLLQADVARAYLKLMKPFDPPIVKKRGVVHIIIYHIGDIDGLMRDVDRNWEESALPGDVQIMLLEACRRMAEAEWRAWLGIDPLVDFAGYNAAYCRPNFVIPFIQYPQFSPYAEVIRSRSYRSYLFVVALANVGNARTHLSSIKVVEAILAEDPFLDFRDHVSSVSVESCFNGGLRRSADDERTAVLVLFTALRSPHLSELEKTKLLQEQQVFPKPRVMVENFFHRYPHNEEKILLLLHRRGWPRDASPGSDCWNIDIEYMGLGRRVPSAMERGRHERHWVLIECDTAYAAELLTLGWAVREGSTSENTANTMTDRDEIWRRPAGLKKADPRILAFGEDSFFKRPAEYRTPANCEDANRVLSTLGNIRLDQSGIGFLIPELGNTLNEMIKSEDPLYHKEYLKLAKENSFNNFVEEFIRSFKKLTCSAEHLAWIAEEEKKRREWKDRLLLRTAQRKGITR